MEERNRLWDARNPRPSGSDAALRTVLVVDDERLVRMVIEHHLGHLGYRMLSAKHSEDALQLCSRHEGAIDLLLTDVNLPGMSGVDLARELQRRRPSLKVLFVSADTATQATEHDHGSAPDGWLEKPFTKQALVARVQQTLGE